MDVENASDKLKKKSWLEGRGKRKSDVDFENIKLLKAYQNNSKGNPKSIGNGLERSRKEAIDLSKLRRLQKHRSFSNLSSSNANSNPPNDFKRASLGFSSGLAFSQTQERTSDAFDMFKSDYDPHAEFGNSHLTYSRPFKRTATSPNASSSIEGFSVQDTADSLFEVADVALERNGPFPQLNKRVLSSFFFSWSPWEKVTLQSATPLAIFPPLPLTETTKLEILAAIERDTQIPSEIKVVRSLCRYEHPHPQAYSSPNHQRLMQRVFDKLVSKKKWSVEESEEYTHFKTVHESWQDSFRSLYAAFRRDKLSYFFFLCPCLEILFLSSFVLRSGSPECVIINGLDAKSPLLFSLLSKNAIEFMLIEHTPVSQRKEYVTTQLDEQGYLLEPGTGKRRKAVLEDRESLSTVQICGRKFVHRFYNLLYNDIASVAALGQEQEAISAAYRPSIFLRKSHNDSISGTEGKSHGLLPRLLSYKPWCGASLIFPNIVDLGLVHQHSANLVAEQSQTYKLHIEGPILPTSLLPVMSKLDCNLGVQVSLKPLTSSHLPLANQHSSTIWSTAETDDKVISNKFGSQAVLISDGTESKLKKVNHYIVKDKKFIYDI